MEEMLKKVFKAIESELEYQDVRWDADNRTLRDGPEHSPEEWIMYMEDYLAEAKHILSREGAPVAYPKSMDIMRKVVTMGIRAMMENGVIDRIFAGNEICPTCHKVVKTRELTANKRKCKHCK